MFYPKIQFLTKFGNHDIFNKAFFTILGTCDTKVGIQVEKHCQISDFLRLISHLVNFNENLLI